MPRLANGGKGSSARAALHKHARNAEQKPQHRLRAAATSGYRNAVVDRTRAASGGSRGAAPGGDGVVDSDNDGDSDGDGDSQRPLREAPDGRDRSAGAGHPRGMAGTLHRRARGGGGPDGDSSDDDDDSRRDRWQTTFISSACWEPGTETLRAANSLSAVTALALTYACK
jgi:hypothetical protein